MLLMYGFVFLRFSAVKEERDKTMSNALRRLTSYEDIGTDATALRQGSEEAEEKLPKPARLGRLEHILNYVSVLVTERDIRKGERK